MTCRALNIQPSRLTAADYARQAAAVRSGERTRAAAARKEFLSGIASTVILAAIPFSIFYSWSN